MCMDELLEQLFFAFLVRQFPNIMQCSSKLLVEAQAGIPKIFLNVCSSSDNFVLFSWHLNETVHIVQVFGIIIISIPKMKSCMYIYMQLVAKYVKQVKSCLSFGVVKKAQKLMPCVAYCQLLFTIIFRSVSDFRVKHENVSNINGHKLITCSS